jgi:hypothetical protein
MRHGKLHTACRISCCDEAMSASSTSGAGSAPDVTNLTSGADAPVSKVKQRLKSHKKARLLHRIREVMDEADLHAVLPAALT